MEKENDQALNIQNKEITDGRSQLMFNSTLDIFVHAINKG